MNTKNLFKYVKLNHFMKDYAPVVRQFRNKNALQTYTEADKKAIAKGVEQLVKDLRREVK
jgi:hypothetical protein